jgi:Raf kinase inhibitor-like YbhB/YbcL family protein
MKVTVPRSSLIIAGLWLAGCASSGAPADRDAGEEEPAADAAHERPLQSEAGPLAPDAAAEAHAIELPADAQAADGALDRGNEADAANAADSTPAALMLASTGFLVRNGELIFPASASYPMDQSPPFSWSGVPASAKSLALTFVDDSNGATKWVLWDIPTERTMLPANLSKTVHPVEVPGSSQRGSLGRTGYSGPGVPGPPLHRYTFVLWALDVEKLPGTDGVDTVALRTKLLPMHATAMSAPLVAKGQEGGP